MAKSLRRIGAEFDAGAGTLATLCACLAMIKVASGRDDDFVALYIVLSALFATLATWVGTEA